MRKETVKTILLVLFLLIIVCFAVGMFSTLSVFTYIAIGLTLVLVVLYSLFWK